MATSKVCSSCKIEKPLSAFSPMKTYRDGHRGQCKACRTEYQQHYGRSPAGKATEKRYYETPKGKLRLRHKRLRYNYGISMEEFNRLSAAQNKACAICEKPCRLLVVDHCHKSGVIRGLLCPKCNKEIGRMGDTYRSFYRIAEYLAGFERRSPNPCGRRVARMIASEVRPPQSLEVGGPCG
jgi:hypothetical protein